MQSSLSDVAGLESVHPAINRARSTCQWPTADYRLNPTYFPEPTARGLFHQLNPLLSRCAIAPTSHLHDLGQSAAPSAHFAAALLVPVSAHLALVSGQVYQRVAYFAWHHRDGSPSALPVVWGSPGFRQDAIPSILGRLLTGNVLVWHPRQRRIC